MIPIAQTLNSVSQNTLPHIDEQFAPKINCEIVILGKAKKTILSLEAGQLYVNSGGNDGHLDIDSEEAFKKHGLMGTLQTLFPETQRKKLFGSIHTLSFSSLNLERSPCVGKVFCTA